MATPGVLSPPVIPGLHLQVTLSDMNKSGAIYNTLPDDKDQPQVAEVSIIALKTLLKQYNVQNKFGLHLIHGHMEMAKGMVMVGKPMHNLPGLWTRPTKADLLDLGAVYGYVFVLTDGEFHPYEFRQGPPPPMTANDNAFIAAAQKYLEINNLADIIGIELLDQDRLGKHMKEFVLSDTDGTVMLPADQVNPTEIYRTTGWNAVEGTIDLKGNETSHAKTTKGTHQVFTDGKALPDVGVDLDAEEVIVEGLREAGIVN
ncbi:hypothetical protein PSPO01_15999 [Paraphaeosphaeria sporulosa]